MSRSVRFACVLKLIVVSDGTHQSSPLQSFESTWHLRVKTGPLPLSHPPQPPFSCLYPTAWQLCLARVGMKGGRVCFRAQAVHRRVEWICMGVTNQSSFLSNIPCLCDTAAASAEGHSGRTSVLGPGAAAGSRRGDGVRRLPSCLNMWTKGLHRFSSSNLMCFLSNTLHLSPA